MRARFNFGGGRGPSGDSGLSRKGRLPSVNVLLRGMTGGVGSDMNFDLDGNIGVIAEVGAEAGASGVPET